MGWSRAAYTTLRVHELLRQRCISRRGRPGYTSCDRRECRLVRRSFGGEEAECAPAVLADRSMSPHPVACGCPGLPRSRDRCGVACRRSRGAISRVWVCPRCSVSPCRTLFGPFTPGCCRSASDKVLADWAWSCCSRGRYRVDLRALRREPRGIFWRYAADRDRHDRGGSRVHFAWDGDARGGDLGLAVALSSSVVGQITRAAANDGSRDRPSACCVGDPAGRGHAGRGDDPRRASRAERRPAALAFGRRSPSSDLRPSRSSSCSRGSRARARTARPFLIVAVSARSRGGPRRGHLRRAGRARGSSRVFFCRSGRRAGGAARSAAVRDLFAVMFFVHRHVVEPATVHSGGGSPGHRSCFSSR